MNNTGKILFVIGYFCLSQLLHVVVFKEIGGLFWLLASFLKAFEAFPVYTVSYLICPSKTCISEEALMQIASIANSVVIALFLFLPTFVAKHLRKK